MLKKGHEVNPDESSHEVGTQLIMENQLMLKKGHEVNPDESSHEVGTVNHGESSHKNGT